jgi:hypothetical protein
LVVAIARSPNVFPGERDKVRQDSLVSGSIVAPGERSRAQTPQEGVLPDWRHEKLPVVRGLFAGQAEIALKHVH